MRADLLPFPPPSLFHLPLLLYPCFTHSRPYSSFFLPLNTASRFGRKFVRLPTLQQRKNGSQLQKLEATKYTWFPRSPELEGTRPTGPVGWLRLCLPLTYCNPKQQPPLNPNNVSFRVLLCVCFISVHAPFMRIKLMMMMIIVTLNSNCNRNPYLEFLILADRIINLSLIT